MDKHPQPAAASTRRHRGVVVPMLTPLTPAGELDEPAAARLIDHLLAGGAHGVFVLGTTGEMPSLPRPLRRRLVDQTVARVAGRAKTYAGVSDTCLADSVEAAEACFDLGVDAVVAHPPGYYALDADEQRAHFADLMDRSPGPVIVYNMPKTTHVSIPIEVLEHLAAHPRAAGLKDSENDPARLAGVMKALGGREDFSIFVGVAALAARALALGADGFVPSAGNLVPDLCRRLFEAAVAGDRPATERLQRELDAVGRIYQRGRSLGGSLAALKAAASALGLCGPTVAPPLRTLDAAAQDNIRKDVQALKLL